MIHYLCPNGYIIIVDGFVKSPTSALCCKVRLMITKFARLEFELFTKPSTSDFLRVYHSGIMDNILMLFAFIFFYSLHILSRAFS